MSDNFAVGESEADTAGPPITREAMGPRLGINVTIPQTGRGEPAAPLEPYLMPSVAGRHGSMEKVSPAIVQTPLGGLNPGPYAIPPAVYAPIDYRQPCPEEGGSFVAGLGDGYPEGLPIPHSA